MSTILAGVLSPCLPRTEESLFGLPVASCQPRGPNRCTCIDATNAYSQEDAEDQCPEVRLYGILRSSVAVDRWQIAR